MAVDPPVLIDGWWVGLRATTLGGLYVNNPSDKHINNAYKVRSGLRIQGYNDISIAGVLGNMFLESGISGGALQNYGSSLSLLPNNGEHLSELDNVTMQAFCSTTERKFGTGLIQWDVLGTTNKIADYAIAHNMMWYSGDLQLMRLADEYNHDVNVDPSHPMFWFGDYSYTWDQFINYNGTPANAADIFRVNRERGGDDTIQQRKDSATFWYQYFIDHPYQTPPVYLLTNKKSQVGRSKKHMIYYN